MKLPLQTIKDGELHWKESKHVTALDRHVGDNDITFNLTDINTITKHRLLKLLESLKAEAKESRVKDSEVGVTFLKKNKYKYRFETPREQDTYNKAIQHQIDSYNELIAYLNK